jgi:hypothetical protein
MGIAQPFRGNPSLKQYLLTQNFVGGLNTKEADDVVTDIEFRELLNADLANQGIITNRKGFKDLYLFNELVQFAVDENGDPAFFPEGTYRLAKVAKDDFNIVQKLTTFKTLAEYRTSLVNDAYELIILFIIDFNWYRLKIFKEEQAPLETVQFDLVYQGVGTGVPVDTVEEEYFVTGQPGSEFNEFIFASYPQNITFNIPVPSPALVISSVQLKRVRYAIPGSGFVQFNLDGIRIEGANSDFTTLTTLYDDVSPFSYQTGGSNNLYRTYKNDLNIDVTPYLDGNKLNIRFLGFANIAMAFDFEVSYDSFYTPEQFLALKRRTKLSENNVEFLDSVYVLPDFEGELFEYDILEDSVEIVEPYQPTPFDVKFVGFNVLADDPLTFIADQGISNKNIEGVFLTIDGNKPVQSIPGGLFELNVIHLGTGFRTDEVGIRFFVDFQSNDEQEIFPRLISAEDLGGLFVFKYNAVGLSNFAGKELTVKLFELDKSVGSNVTENVGPSQFNTTNSDTLIKVVSTAGFVVESDYLLSQEGFYETVRVKQIVSATELRVYGKLSGVYVLASNPRLFSPQEKTTGLTFDPYLDTYRIVSTFSVVPQAVEKLSLSGFKMLEINFRMVYYGQKVIWFSDLYQFNYVPNYNFISLPLGTTDQIQRIVFFRGSYIIFTKDEIYKMVGTFGAGDFRIESVNKFVGCIAPNSVRNVGNELFFLTRDGLYKLKSSVFQDNLENVEKIDKSIADDVQISEFVDSLLYDEQYILYYNEGEQYDTLRLYYDIELGRSRNPFVRDIFTIKPELFVREEGRIFALNNGRWFVYGEGFTDFMPNGTEDSNPYTYPCRIETSSLSLRYPTHQKKFKNIFIKALHGEKIVPLFITTKVDGYEVLTPESSQATVNELGEVEYNTTVTPNLNLISSAFLGELELGLTPLGEITQQVHKISFSGKGKNIKLIIEQRLDSSFGIISIGYLFKLGKVKE